MARSLDHLRANRWRISLEYWGHGINSQIGSERSRRTWPAIILIWPLVVLFFAAHRYGCNATQGKVEPCWFYIWACAYMLAVLTPAAVWLAWRFPITSPSWRRHLPLHIIASLLLTGAQVLLQAGFGWVRSRGEITWAFALRHYFSHVEQISLLTYWLLVAAALFYRAREDA